MSYEMSVSDSFLYKIRHSMAHVLAQAVKVEFPERSLVLVLLSKRVLL